MKKQKLSTLNQPPTCPTNWDHLWLEMKNPTYNQSRNFSESYSHLSAKADSQTKNSKGHIMREIYSITILGFCLFCLTSFAVKADDGLANTLIKCDSARVGDIKSAVERNLGHVSVILHENENTYLYCKLNQDRYERIAHLGCDYIEDHYCPVKTMLIA